MINSSSPKDYVNSNFAPAGDRLSTFNTAADFFGEIDFPINEKYHLAVEYSYLISSYTTTSFLGVYDLSLNLHRPSLLGYYEIPGKGYKFKFGAGIGYRLVNVTEKLPGSNNEPEYSSGGMGFLLKAQGNTLLSDRIYALIALDLRLDYPGEPESEGANIKYNSTGEVVNFNMLSIGIKLGISYLL
ncbi:MAG: hypothetical protein K9J12_11355 [Melioribacteraceae bacterium]|nr:hypothetical protein [Melioribacteraceae bacterium]MCF8263964.1 hypothetical protein [Melioribacteraceae bacterium]MCF8411816.1 hypothetical protein [Melioribacteraceae bacterium]MCF8431815.1 hypothetical protein [Melioribacteraceae bacterium]